MIISALGSPLWRNHGAAIYRAVRRSGNNVRMVLFTLSVQLLGYYSHFTPLTTLHMTNCKVTHVIYCWGSACCHRSSVWWCRPGLRLWGCSCHHVWGCSCHTVRLEKGLVHEWSRSLNRSTPEGTFDRCFALLVEFMQGFWGGGGLWLARPPTCAMSCRDLRLER
jgi:hypothetical protein